MELTTMLPQMPCYCTVGRGKQYSFQSVEDALNQYCERLELPLHVIGVGVCDPYMSSRRTPNAFWTLDITSTDPERNGPLWEDKTVLAHVRKLSRTLKGRIDGIARKSIRVKVVLKNNDCEHLRAFK